MEAGSALELMVQAVNGGSQSVPSDSILFTVPVAEAAQVEAAPLVTALPNGNGNGNGQTTENGSRATVSRLS